MGIRTCGTSEHLILGAISADHEEMGFAAEWGRSHRMSVKKPSHLSIAALCLIGCASARQHPDRNGDGRRLGVPAPSPQALARKCDQPKPSTNDAKPMALTYVMTCPMLPGYKWQQIVQHALKPAARLGVRLETERFYAAPEPTTQPARFTVAFYYPSTDLDHAWLKVDPPSDLFSMLASEILSDQELRELRAEVAIRHEDIAYEECEPLVLDIAYSTKEPAKAQACANLMAAIDRARSARQQLRHQKELERIQQEQLREARRQREETARLRDELEARQQQEEEMERRRRLLLAIGIALGSVHGRSQVPAYAAPSSPSALRLRGPTNSPTDGQQGSHGCSSDFQCPFGNVCVKPNFSSTGTCMRSVNEFGGATYNMPRLDSVGPKLPNPTDCNYTMSCPIGFRCDFASGTCVK